MNPHPYIRRKSAGPLVTAGRSRGPQLHHTSRAGDRLGMLLWSVLCLLALPLPARGQDDVANVPSKDLRAGGDEQKRYFLIGPGKSDEAAKDVKPPADGYKLLVVMPGGDGSADFHPFVKRIFVNALPEGWLVAQSVAVQWSKEQAEQVVWPTKKNPRKDMKFSTEEFVEAVIADVGKAHKLDAKHVYTLSWSSSGPAAYAISLQEKTAVRGSFIAMSVFYPDQLPELSLAKGRAYYLYQSPDDKTCKIDFARDAKKALADHGARVTLAEYEGGHGWHGDVYGNIRKGVEWLQNGSDKSKSKTGKEEKSTSTKEEKSGHSETKQSKSSKKESSSSTQTKSGGNKSGGSGGGGKKGAPNLIVNGGFEKDLDPWVVVDNSGRLKSKLDNEVAAEGKQSLRLSKTGGTPVDIFRCDLTDLPKGASVKVSARIKSKDVKNAWFKFLIYDENDQPLVKDVDIAHIMGTNDWDTLKKTFKVPKKAARAEVMIMMVLDGTVWLDDVRVVKVKKESGETKKSKSGGKKSGKSKGAGKPGTSNLLANGDFEDGLAPWEAVDNSGRLKSELDKDVTTEGKQSLRLSKTGGIPADMFQCELTDLPKGASVKVSARIKSKDVKNAWFKFRIYDEDGEVLNEADDVAHITGTNDWETQESTFEVPEEAARAEVIFMLVLDGTVWVDDVKVEKDEE